MVCGVITETDPAVVSAAEPLVAMFEVRIDLIGPDWPDIARSLQKPWIACNRRALEGGRAGGDEGQRIEGLLKAIELGASIVDLELSTPNLAALITRLRKKARCMISHHDFSETPSTPELEEIINRQLAAGADICKVATTARCLDDNLRLLSLYRRFPEHKLVAFGMSEAGILSRVLAPFAGAEFVYASLGSGKESAPGQLTAVDLVELYGLLKR